MKAKTAAIFDTLQLTLFAYWGPALINGDLSGYEADEIEAINAMYDDLRSNHGYRFINFVDMEDSEDYGHAEYGTPSFGRVAVFTAHVVDAETCGYCGHRGPMITDEPGHWPHCSECGGV